MKKLNNYINEASNKECRYFDVFQNKFVDGTRDDMRTYEAKYMEACPDHWGEAPKEADPDNLLQGAIRVTSSEKTKQDIRVAFDRHHPDYNFNSCKSVVAVEKNEGGYDAYKAFKDKYPYEDYFIAHGNVYKDTWDNKSMYVLDIHLS